MDLPLTRALLHDLPRHTLHRGRNLTKARIDRVEVEGRPIVLKDLAARPWPVRVLFGPWQLDREARAYARLEGVAGVPRFLGRVDRQAIALEFVAGRPLAGFRPGELPAAFFDRLDGILEAIHAAGVAHGDLHRHDVLVGPGGEPCLVDFSTSLVMARGDDPLTAFLFRQMCRADRRSAAKLRLRFLPGSAAPVPARPALYRLGRRLKRLLDLARRRP
jgi:tRNA A-37 threonylcarbamoyl transferase component Bud32